MPQYYFKTNGEPVKCVNCQNDVFTRHDPLGGLLPYECQRCHFVSWFPEEFAPAETPPEKK